MNNNQRPGASPRGRGVPSGQGHPGRVGNQSQNRSAGYSPKPASTPVKNQKIKLTPEQIERNKANRKRELYYLKKKRAAAMKAFLTRFMLYLVLVVFLGLLTLGIFWANLTNSDTDSESRYTYIIGDSKTRLNYSKAVRDGRLYISFTDIAGLCDFAVTGSPEDMNFVIKDNDNVETIRFFADSRAAYVNGIETRLGAAAIYEDGEVYVPVEFVSAFLKGVTVEVNEKAHEVEVQRIIINLNENGKLPKGEEPVYEKLSFLLQSAQGLKPLNEEELADVAQLPDLGFVTNMLIYEPYMNPGNISDYLTLVNINYQLSPDYSPQDLMGLVDTRKDVGRQTQQMCEYAAWAIEAMFKELRAAGYEDVSITSAYRSYSYQESIYNSYLVQYNNDYEYVSSISNPAGASEHQLGLSADLHNLPAADVSFGETEAFTWLRDNCWKFGFILRYPEDKVDVTGVSYEPWHYRYVGRYHAQKIYEEGLCLEEYLDKYYPEIIGQLPG